MKRLTIFGGLAISFYLAGCEMNFDNDDHEPLPTERISAEDTPTVSDKTDDLGILLADVGLGEGDAPCAGAEQLASVIDGAGRYAAFCRDESGTLSAAQVAPVSVPLIDTKDDVLALFLAMTPDTTAVPEALVGGQTDLLGVRATSKEAVVHISPTLYVGGFQSINSCTSGSRGAAYFQNTYCSIIEDWADGYPVKTSWCNTNALSGNSQRTASSQGDAFYEGRQVVAACGTNSTRLRRYVLGALTQTWKNVYNDTILPGHVLGRIVKPSMNIEKDIFGDGYYGADLRFRIEPMSGAWYRYSGGYVGYPPVP